jgi:hypothetical protein
MKNVDLRKRVEINKVRFVTVIALLSYLITACAGNRPTVSEEEFKQYRDSQQEWLLSLQEGQSPEVVIRPVLAYQQYFFRYKENEKLFEYVQGQYPITRMLFGLFFEDGRLTSLLLDQAVTDFGTCRFNQLKQKDTWPLDGFQTTASWIRLQSRIGDDYEDASAEAYPQNAKDSGGISANEAIEIATHLPLAVVALPLYGVYKMAGGPYEQPLQSGDPKLPNERAIQIELGETTDDELMQLLGAPDGKGGTKQLETWAYVSPDILFGIVAGTVTSSESLYWYVPRNSETVTSESSCVPPD